MCILSASRLEQGEGNRPGEVGDKNTMVRRRARSDEAARMPDARPARRAGLAPTRASA